MCRLAGGEIQQVAFQQRYRVMGLGRLSNQVLHPTALSAASSTAPRALQLFAWRKHHPASAQRVKTTVSAAEG